MYSFDAKNHIHLLDGSPLYGTTTVIKELMPPFLAKWGATCAADHIEANWDNYFDQETARPRKKLFEDAILAWSKVRAEAANKGTDMHAALEAYVSRMITDFDGKPQLLNDASGDEPDWKKVQAFAEWATHSVDRFILAEKYTYSRRLWTGGVVDCLAKMRDGSLAVIDFKSSKEAYFNQFVQAAGYSLQLKESGYGNADGTDWQTLTEPITKLIVVPFGAKELKPPFIENVEGYKDAFEHIVRVYEYLRSFNEKAA